MQFLLIQFIVNGNGDVCVLCKLEDEVINL